jgi:hypothetical protein
MSSPSARPSAGKISKAGHTNLQGHSVNWTQLKRLLRLVARTEDEELSCDECFELLPQYVDREVSGGAPNVLSGEASNVRLPLFRHHVEQCAVCREEYETLRELARLEAEGRPPSIDDLRRSL